MKPASFAYEAPDSVEGAVALLAERGPDAKPLAGGLSLVPLMNLRLAAPSALVDLGRIRDLDTISMADGQLAIGALTRHAAVASSDVVQRHVPLLARAASLVGYPAIRTRGTLGGSVAHADPAAELPLAAVALDARIRLVGPRGDRWLRAEEFFLGYFTTALEDGEVLTEIRFATDGVGGSWAFEEFARKSGDFAVAAAAVDLRRDGDRVSRARIALAGAADRPVRATRTEAALRDRPLARTDLREVAEAIADEVVDADASDARDRRHLVAVLARRALERAWQRDGADR